MSNDALIIAVFSGIGVVITAIATALITLRKSKAELDKGVIEEWQMIVKQLHTTVKEQDVELKSQRADIMKLNAEVAELRVQIAARETERIEQRGEIRTLEKHVGELKKPDTQALAEAIAPKLAEVMGVPTPVTIVPAAEPLPVVETKSKPKES